MPPAIQNNSPTKMASSSLQQQRPVVLLLLAMVMAVAAAGAAEFFCDGGACGGFAEEEMSRRILIASLATRYISYGALSKDRVPCSQAGRSYYGCGGSGPANPYSRGCTRITHCLRDIS